MTTRIEDLTDGQLNALHVLAVGMASRGTENRNDPARFVRCVHTLTARRLVELGLAREVTAWDSFEITDDGRAVLASWPR